MKRSATARTVSLGTYLIDGRFGYLSARGEFCTDRIEGMHG